MKVKLKVWRQKDATAAGGFREYETPDLNPNMSFLGNVGRGQRRAHDQGRGTIAFDHDCREGICGTCSLVINGKPHGPHRGVATCQTYMRNFNDGDSITVEPFRAKAFPVIKDLIVDRSGLRPHHAGGRIHQRPHRQRLRRQWAARWPKRPRSWRWTRRPASAAARAWLRARTRSAMLFVSPKVSQFGLLPQGQPERDRRVLAMVKQMDAEGFGNCTN